MSSATKIASRKQFLRMRWDRSSATVFLAFLVMLVNNGFIIAGMTTFDGSMLGAMGLSFAGLKFRDTVTIISLGVSVPFVGFLLDRVRVRPIIVCGLVLMAAGFSAYFFVRLPWQMYAAQALLGASQAFCGLISHVVLISRWTSLHRGLALGLVVAGSSLGNAVIPALNGVLLSHFPWREAILFGGLAAVLLIPVVYAVYRERPPETAMRDGPPAQPAVAQSAVVQGTSDTTVDSPTAGVVGEFNVRDFWLLGLVAGTSVLCVLGLVTNLYLYVAKDLNIGGNAAQQLLFVLFFGSSIAQIGAGLAADKMGAAVIHRTALALMLLGMLGVLFVPFTFLAPMIAVFGIGWGANSAMLQLQPVALFLTAILGRTLGMLAVMETVGGAIAPALVGYGRDLSGSYRLSFAALTAVMVVSVICVCLIRGPKRPTPTTARA